MKALYYTVTFLAALVVLTAAGFESYIHCSEIVSLVDAAVTKPLSAARHKKCKCAGDCKCGRKCDCDGTDKKCCPDCTCPPPKTDEPKPATAPEPKKLKATVDVK